MPMRASTPGCTAPASCWCVRRNAGRRRWSTSRAGSGKGTPRPGYIELVVEAARDWKLPRALHSLACALVAVGMARRARRGNRGIRMRRESFAMSSSAAACRAWATALSTEYTALEHRPGGLGAQPARRRGRGGVRGAGRAVAAMVEAVPPRVRRARASMRSRSTRRTPEELALRGSARISRSCGPV